tara:strand:- start:907 stop:1218 length:312 start_codon:yes stop_codon:yes gene_type:complete
MKEYILRWTLEKRVEVKSTEEAQEIAENSEDFGDVEDFEIVEVKESSMKRWTSTITYTVTDIGRECETEEEYRESVKQSFKEEHNIQLYNHDITDIKFEEMEE